MVSFNPTGPINSVAALSNYSAKFPDVVNSNTTTKMSETMSIDTHDTSNDATGEDPLHDFTDDQIYQLLEDTLYDMIFPENIKLHLKSFKLKCFFLCVRKLRIPNRGRILQLRSDKRVIGGFSHFLIF